jgi:Na+-translocating ferredoxin:NAD+ oxidoreductase RnfA subunit
MNPELAAFLAGLTALSPVVSLGIIPSSYQGMTRRPWLAAPYAAAGSLMILPLTILGWTAHRLVLPRLGLEILGLPALIMIYWGLQYLFGTALRDARPVRAGLPLNLNGGLALGCCLAVIELVPHGLVRVAVTAAGMSAGHLVATLALSHLREGIDSGRMSPLLRGWPVVLGLCSLMWLAARGIGSLLP